MVNSALPETVVNALKAPPGVSHIELRSTFQFLSDADLAALKSYLGISGEGGGPILVADISDATANGRALLTGAPAVVGAGNVMSPDVVMMPRLLVVTGDSLSCSGTQYFPPGFSGTSTGLSGSPNSYNAVASYPGGDATGVKPMTSWPEKLIGTAGSTTNLFNFAHAGAALSDRRKYFWQECYLVAPRVTGVPAGLAIYLGTNDLNQDWTPEQIWGWLQDICNYGRMAGFGPIILITLQPSTDTDAVYAVGGRVDAKRLAVNGYITGSSGVADIVIDVNAIDGLMATNAPTTGQHYTHDNAYYESANDLHFSELGNTRLGAAVFAAMKSYAGNVASRTQVVQTARIDLVEQVLAPWAHRRLAFADRQTSTSGGSVYTDPAPYGLLGIQSGTADGNYAVVYWGTAFLGTSPGWSGGDESRKDNDWADWGRPIGFAIALQFDSPGTAHENTAWYVGFGKRNTPSAGAPADGDHFIGLKFENPSDGVVNIYAVAANGTAAYQSSLLATTTGLAGGANGQINCLGYADGYGNLAVSLNGKHFAIGQVAPTKALIGGSRFTAEVVTAGGTTSATYVWISPPVVFVW